MKNGFVAFLSWTMEIGTKKRMNQHQARSRPVDVSCPLYHPQKVDELGSSLRDLCFDRLEGAGEAHLQVKTCIELGQCITMPFNPQVYWRPDKVSEPWERWKDAHVQIESPKGNPKFTFKYRSLLAANATCLRPPDGV